jgi:S1-C subfamily serine protease
MAAFGTAEASSRRWNRAAVWAFAIAVLGIPLFGIVTGLVAIVVGCIALAGHSRSRRGLGLAVFAIVIGLADVVGWGIGMAYYLDSPHAMVALDQLAIDPESLKELPEKIARAMRANVVIESVAGLGRQGLGSGVILRVKDGSAYIVTNRHVVDQDYTDESRTAPDPHSLRGIAVMTVKQESVPAKVEWLAPHGIDLAIISAHIDADGVAEARWDRSQSPHIGDSVFAVGNPHGLGWTESAGGISQVRRQTHGDYSFRVLQMTAAINPGNSGGGLYDNEGRLIGINTLTSDKRLAEGLGFAIAFPTLLDLAGVDLHLPDKNPEAPSP